jgi:hypothetical protein
MKGARHVLPCLECHANTRQKAETLTQHLLLLNIRDLLLAFELNLTIFLNYFKAINLI